LKAGMCVRRVRFVMLAPDPRHHRRFQADPPLIALSEFGQPPLWRSSKAGSKEWGADGRPIASGFLWNRNQVAREGDDQGRVLRGVGHEEPCGRIA
jgi:hypothetical protein